MKTAFSFITKLLTMHKQLLNLLLISIGIISIALTTLTLAIYYRGIPKYDVPIIDFNVDYNIANLEKGKKIAEMACKSCHYDHATNQLTGRFMSSLSSSLGKIYSSNITNHKANGVVDFDFTAAYAAMI